MISQTAGDFEALAHDTKVLRVLKRQAQALCGVVFGLAMVSFALGGVAVNGDRERTAFALPALEVHDTWGAEVDQFGERVTDAFGVRPVVADQFSEWILEASIRQDFEPELIAGLIATESSFRKVARSHVGAIGPAQVRPDYWSRFCGTANLEDPEQNVYCGAQVLAYYRDRCGDEVCALQSYNIGPYSKRERAAARYVSKVDRNRSAMSSLAAL